MKDDKQRSSAARLSKLSLPFFLMVGLTLFFLFGGHKFLSLSQFAEHYTSLKAFVNGQLATALLVFGAAYILTVALSLPVASLLTLAGGALFGWTAAAVITFAATIGATVVFISARTVLNEFFVKRTTGFMTKLKSGFRRMPFLTFCPSPNPRSPFRAVATFALLRMRVSHYMLATFIGITPGTLIYVWAAKSFDICVTRADPGFVWIGKPAITVPLSPLDCYL